MLMLLSLQESILHLRLPSWTPFYASAQVAVHVQEVEKGKGRVAPVPAHFGAAAFTADDAREWQEWQEYSQDYSRYEYEIDEDDEVSHTS